MPDVNNSKLLVSYKREEASCKEVVAMLAHLPVRAHSKIFSK
ncbi:MAG: hypothetical protein OJF59_000921 [Cytophagales bacterium]|nr:MAG: hypothetical protein OJF59_000921 [Cytophagales bacterium]